ncbi:uncharacterized protein DUF5063 [Mumia flava]|uniref:Uncharacterized protein DUF5063 n=1 Tax=Mumia flava TaxID=1348852 RepID=A0A2M9BHM5_9ACTN|nr:DUF5063 domain-containing protein [Mumia flava]PJJ57437.1 uncharacterized protein DUF5063 [Mumia flava]
MELPAGHQPTRDELRAIADVLTAEVTDALASLQRTVGGDEPRRLVAELLVELSRILTVGARLGAMPRFVPPEPFEPDAGPEPELDEVRVRLATTLDGFDSYVEVFDPHETPVEIIESRISDDVFSLVSALAHGLQHARDGRPLEALWWWQFSYLSSWGSETTAAVRALQALVARDRL